MKIAILADSGCQISKSEEGIYIAPLTITIDGKGYLDNIEITSLEVFERMDKEDIQVMTSQPATGVIQEVVEQIKADGYEHIIALPIGTGLSSTLNGMKLACDLLDMPVTLVDTKATARNHAYLVEAASKLIKENKSIEEIKTILEDLVEHSCTMITVSDLKQLKKGGRVTPAVAALAGLLKIVPVMKLNNDLGGKIDTFDKVRTFKKANLKIVEHFIDDCKVNASEYVFAIEHVLCEDMANQMKELMIEKLGPCDILVKELPAVVGAHMGIGGIGFQYIKKLS